ncbi:MAG: tetratricopeptide repeat protein, partial [Chloroflexota bacterium]
ALAAMGKGDFRSARRDLSRVIREQPNNAAAYHKRGIAYSERDKFDKALEDFEQAIKLAPTTPEFLVSLGELEIELEMYPNAIGYLKRALLHQSDDKSVLYQRTLGGLSLAYYLNADDDQATDYYNQLANCDLAYGDTVVWETRFNWSPLLIEAAQEMIDAIEAQDES